MTFLPIVQRELRVAARRRATFRIRRWTTYVAAAMSVALIFFVEVVRRTGLSGNLLFSVLTYYALVLCLLAGGFLTADCLSEEKREGTLGLLFLTDLRGYDVVLGKFVATSLNAFYGLLAVFPVLAVALLLGGVTGGEFWRLNLALVNALFFSLALGLWVSARSHEAAKAMAATLVLVVGLVGAFGIAQIAAGLGGGWRGLWVIGAASPLCAFLGASEAEFVRGPWRFWASLGLSQLIGWGLLALASRALPRRWQAETARPPRFLPGRWRQRRAPAARRAAATARLREDNPVLWLSRPSPATRRMAWGVAALFVAGQAAALAAPPDSRDEILMIAGMYWGRACGFALKVLFALQACRFFVEARRSGALELLLCTPLSNREILNGQWQALGRTFAGPVAVLLTAQTVTLAVAMRLTLRPLNLSQVSWWAGAAPTFIALVSAGYQALAAVMDYAALGCLGVWLALVLRNPGYAAGLTILGVLLLPSFAFCVPDVLIDAGFIAFCLAKLLPDLRRLAAQAGAPAALSP